MVYKIVKYGHPALELLADPITEFGTAELDQLVADLFESMYAAKGVGLAAPQVGICRRIAVIDCSIGENEKEKIVLINPEIVHAAGKQNGEEGCLSLPGFREDVRRPLHVTVRAQDAGGAPVEINGSELLARALLHETDHLNGKLYISYVSALKRDLIKRKIRKKVKQGEWV